MTKIAPLFLTIPHSGEKIPEICPWLQNLPEQVLLCDLDRFVDLLYAPAMQQFSLPGIQSEWHRYAVDLNRFPEDIDAGSVENHALPVGTHGRGFHWQYTTRKQKILPKAMRQDVHEALVQLVYTPFHERVRLQYQIFRDLGCKNIFHLDCHSMPSMGTDEHRDPGERRADVVISDCAQKSADPRFVDLVIAAYVRAGFKVGYNWPYLGGRLTEFYGQPHLGQHSVQVELSRGLYMDELSKSLLPTHLEIQKKLTFALQLIQQQVAKL